MPLFKRKPDNLIPPVTPISLPSATSPRPSPNTYPISTASRDDARNYSSDLPPYNRIRGAGDVYSRGTAELDKDRNELFSGYNPTKSGSGRFFDGPGDKDSKNQGDGDDVEGIKEQTRFVKQESVNSTRNALRFAREAEETGRNTLVRLGEQSEKLNDTERYLDIAKDHSKQAAKDTDAIKQLNRSIFIPAIVHNNRRPPEAQEEDEASYRQSKNAGDILLRSDLLGGERVKTNQRSAGREQYKRYQFEGTASDDEMEDEMSSNLDEISEATKRLKALGMAMGDELSLQNEQIDKISGKTERLDNKLRVNTDRLKKIK